MSPWYVAAVAPERKAAMSKVHSRYNLFSVGRNHFSLLDEAFEYSGQGTLT